MFVGVVAGLGIAVATFVFWGIANALLLSAFSGSASGYCGEQLFGVYTSTGARIYIVILEVVTALICATAIVQAVRWARASRPGRAVALMLVTFVRLLPATMCDTSMIYGPCP